MPNPQPAPQGDDPGKTLAIVGIILAFFISIVGLILSIIAKKKSKAAGYNNTLATVGIILNAISLAIGVILLTVISFIILTAYHGVQDRAETTNMAITARSLDKKMETYNVEKGSYPSSLAKLFSDTSSDYYHVDPSTQESISSAPITEGSNKVAIYVCSQDDDEQYARVDYWDTTTNKVVQVGSGLSNSSSTSTCTILK